jgi:hypothetical protein
MAGNYAAQVFYNEKKEQIKQQLYGLYTPDEHEQELKLRLAKRHIRFTDSNQPMPTPAQTNWCYTGFFMRSILIASWIGLEIVAKGKDPNDPNATTDRSEWPLQVIRFERISPDTIFCICEGIISEIELTQPSESVHFGITDKNGSYSINDKPLPFKKVNGVIDIVTLAASSNLNVNDGANMAKAMLAKPLKVKVNIKWLAQQTYY